MYRLAITLFLACLFTCAFAASPSFNSQKNNQEIFGVGNALAQLDMEFLEPASGKLNPVTRVNFTVEKQAATRPQKVGIDNILHAAIKFDFEVDEKGRPFNFSVDQEVFHEDFAASIFTAIKSWHFLNETGADFEQSWSHSITEDTRFSSRIKTRSLHGYVRAMKKRAERGDAEAAYAYAHILEFNNRDLQDLLKRERQNAAYWYRKAAEKGIVGAKYMLGKFLVTQSTSETDAKAEGLKLILEAGQQGYAKANYWLGRRLIEQSPNSKYFDQSIKFLEAAADSGYALAAKMLADVLSDASTPAFAPTKAVVYADKAMRYRFIDPSFYRVAAKAHKAAGKLKQAERLLIKAIAAMESLSQDPLEPQRQLARIYAAKEAKPQLAAPSHRTLK